MNGRPATTAEKEQAKQLYAEGFGYHEIGRQMKRDHSVIRRWVDRSAADIQRDYSRRHRERQGGPPCCHLYPLNES